MAVWEREGEETVIPHPEIPPQGVGSKGTKNVCVALISALLTSAGRNM